MIYITFACYLFFDRFVKELCNLQSQLSLFCQHKTFDIVQLKCDTLASNLTQLSSDKASTEISQKSV